MEERNEPNIPRLDRHRFDGVGQCIYCGETDDLRDEHIVPYGLGGNLVLPDSSCGACAEITSRIELKVLRGSFRPIRVMRGIQSRRKHRGAPTKLPLQVRYGDEWETIELPHHEYPLLLHFLVYDLPGCLEPEAYTEGLRVRGHLTYSFGPRPEQVVKDLGADEIRVSQTDGPSEFAKMTAKVAYSMAVASGAVDPRRGRPEVVRSVLGELNEIGRWVGMVSRPRQWIRDVLHYVGIKRDREHNLLIGEVQYLTDTGTPTYSVVLGTLDDVYVTDLALRTPSG
ncbi:hypothetical protein [Gaopeijia maritima]|uniref:HNH endonuclease 5 domain-containing protein n=1 Tax=Gaopeijia maritima TaxID=3119007 RepID=A0ABU9ECQ6_9BACT